MTNAPDSAKTTDIQSVMNQLKFLEYLVIDKKGNLVIVFDRVAMAKHGEEKVKRIYLIRESGNLEEFDVNGAIRDIVKNLSGKVELRSVLEEVVKTSSPADIVEALKRLKSKKKVEVGKGCVSVLLHGSRGQRPIEFAIRSG
jgi:hypothetical protein